MIRSLFLTGLLTLSVCACAQDAPPNPSGAAAVSEREEQTTEQQREAVTPPTAQEQADQLSESEQATAAQETAGEGTAEDRADVTLERLAALPADQQLPTGRWKPGTHYKPIVPAQPTGVAPGKVEVTEVFWYGCGHCYALEPYLERWRANKPEYIEFVRVPVMWGPAHRAHARLFYTLEALGRSDLHQAVFETIHQKRDMLLANDEAQTAKMHAQFAQQHGISADEFNKAYNSFGVNSNLQRAEQLTRRYQVEGVPMVVVAGKYSTDVGSAGGQSELLALINDLASAEQRR